MQQDSPTRPGAGALDHRTLVALIEASRAIHEELKPAEVCQRVTEHAKSVLHAEGASVLLHDAQRETFVFHTVAGPPEARVIHSQRFSSELGIAGQVLRTGRPVFVNDVRDNSNFYAGIDSLTNLTTKSLLAAPLVHRGHRLGVIEVVNRVDGGHFDQSDLDVLRVLANIVSVAAENAQTVDRLDRRSRAFQASRPAPSFVGASPAFRKVLQLCDKVASAATTVLLTGETGTGKEMAAQAIHAASLRADQPFIAINCAALPESLIESELFGHEQGAFTGATKQSIGRFELADGGTLLLDEIGEIEPAMQSKLLRVLETGEITRVGGSETIPCDVRVIAATNRDLRAEVDAGNFREDLFYRLSVFPIQLPPLRERREDLPLLIEHLIARVVPALGVSAPEMSDDALACIRAYHWPGNIRELRNVVERAALLADGRVTPAHLPDEIAHAGRDGGTASAALDDTSGSMLAEQERKLIVQALEDTNWNQSAAARKLGITRDILRYRVKRYGLVRAD